jgi:glycosyltransferase involved in cell wall biosynthesis
LTIIDLVSVIIPCYNSGKFISETVTSVVKQTYPNVEIIIVDDGSTDPDTLKYLSTLQAPNISVYLKEHEGVSIARNYGIEKSTGDFILPLDADDLISEDYLELAIAAFKQLPKVKLVSCSTSFFGYIDGSLAVVEYSLEKLLARNLFVVSSLFKRSDYMQTKGFNPNMKDGFEDWDFWISLLGTGGEVYQIEKTCFFYRIHKNSRNNQLNEEKFSALRMMIYENHKVLFQQYFFDPKESFEYKLIRDSREYQVGSLILKPFRILQRFNK